MIYDKKNVINQYGTFAKIYNGLEVVVMKLFDDEYTFRTYIESEKREAVEEVAKKIAYNLSEMGMSAENIAKAVSASVKQAEEWPGLLQ